MAFALNGELILLSLVVSKEGGEERGKKNPESMSIFENAILSILTSLTCGFI